MSPNESDRRQHPDPDPEPEVATGVKPPADPDSPTTVSRKFPIVGIGASAGGLEAINDLLRHLPPDPGMSLVVVQHLDPRQESQLPEILAAGSKMPVRRAEDGLPIEENQVYVNPSNATLEVIRGRVRLTPRREDERPFMPVDHMLRSLAVDRGNRAIGLLLSGGGTDGTLGMQAIKAADGITFAQNERTAIHDSMPRSAVMTGCVDFVLSPAEIAAELSRIGKHSYLSNPDIVPVSERTTESEEVHLRAIFALLRAAFGVDFLRYKRSTLLRRTRRRMALRRIEHLAAYVELLQLDPEELKTLYSDFLIRVTSFFRDPEVFETLQRTVFPSLIRDRDPESPIRIWVAGCSTGEEVYSLAISLLESLGDEAGTQPIKILATDINERALEIARAGIYIENIEADVSAERLRRYFVRVEGSYQIKKAVRDLCIFSRHDLTRDPPFSRMDLVSCRNLLIYLEAETQRRILPLFHYALKPSGFLLLGPAETISSYSDLFAPIHYEQKIFSRVAAATAPSPNFEASTPGRWSDPAAKRRGLDDPVGYEVQHEADRLLLARYTPPGVLIDDQNHILQYRGATDTFVAPPIGTAAPDLLKQAAEGLMSPLRMAIEMARSGRNPVRRKCVRVDAAGKAHPLTIQVIPLVVPVQETGYYLVLFEASDSVEAPEEPIASAPNPDVGDQAGEDDLNTVRTLRAELKSTREYLQSILERNEAATEELKSANEEILSSNEELQSTNEELQTAKEEMQSTNEELSTVNEELNHRNRELGRINDDLINLFSSVNIAIVMVKRELRIRRYTVPAEKMMNLIASDLGRPIGDIRPRFDVPDLDRRIREVIQTLVPQDHEARDRDGRWYSVRIRPYITLENRIDGAVIAIVDINQIKRNQDELSQALENADAIIETVWQPLVVIDGGFAVVRSNRAFYRTFGLRPEEVIGRSLLDVCQGPWTESGLAVQLGRMLNDGHHLHDQQLEGEFAAIGLRTFLVNARPIDLNREAPLILVAMEDITLRKRELERTRILLHEQAARAEAESASRRKDEFLAMLAHELRNPLAPIFNALLTLRSPDMVAEDLTWALDVMERQIRHMTRLIDDLLDVSRIMRGSIRLRRELIELAPLVRHVVEAARPYIELRRHDLSLELTKEPISLIADPVRLEQVFTNLLHNAAKYTEEGGKIWVQTAREDREVVIRVRDNGIGLAPDQLPNVFELFMQVDRSLDRSQGGLGIGLTLVKNLVELHGGKVRAYSRGLGLGSEFVVRLPIATVNAAPTPTPPITRVPAGESRRVLVVEDNVDSAHSLGRLLTRWGHDVRIALDGTEGIETARSFRPDVVLMDIGLPGMDGYQVVRRLRGEPAAARALMVALTGYGQEEDRRRALDAGFDRHLTKPVDPLALRDVLGARHEPRA